MSDLPPLEQQFSFEASVVRLEDGSFFQPLREARCCFAVEIPCGYRMSGSEWQALYECKDGRFIFVEFSSQPQRPGLWTPSVLNCDNVGGAVVTPEVAFEFLVREQLPIPDGLQTLLANVATQDNSASEEECRNLAFWIAHRPQQAGKHSQKVQVIVLLEEIRDAAIEAVHEIRCWPSLDSGSRSHTKTVVLLLRLNESHRVNPVTWWGAKDKVPPESVSLLGLPWPAGIDELKNRVIPRLNELVSDAATVLFCNMPISHCGLHPTNSEMKLAEESLISRCEEIDKLVATLISTIQDLRSGKVFESLPPKGPPKVRKPKDWEMKAYLMHKNEQKTYGEIKKDLNLRIDTTNIGRGIERVSKWLGGGNVMPPRAETPKLGKPKAVDPRKLDLRSRQSRKNTSEEE